MELKDAGRADRPVSVMLGEEMAMGPAPTRILILGGGFGGVYTALTLERLLRRDLRLGTVEITL